MVQELLKMVSSDLTESDEKSVTLFIQARLFVLNGVWIWDMQSSAIYASDVMSFPAQFEGTKGIIHPEDLPDVINLLQRLRESELQQFEFRMITTYGEVKKIIGKNISLEEKIDIEALASLEEQIRTEKFDEIISQKEKSSLNLQQSITEYAGRVYGLGYWYVNKSTGEVWYSDNVFHIHGLPAQSLNAHSHTFSSFIHEEDRTIVHDAFENAYFNEVSLNIEYRIVLSDGMIKYVQELSQWFYSENGQLVFGSVLKDNTESKALEAQLDSVKSKIELDHQIMDYADHEGLTGHWTMNLVTRKAFYSGNFFKIFGIKHSLSADKNIFLSLVHPEDSEKVNLMYDQIYREHILPETEFRIIRPDGRQRYIRQSGKVIVSNDNELLMIGVIQDITVRMTQEQKIREHQEIIAMQKAIIEGMETNANISSVIWFSNEQMYWSDGFYKMLGYRPGGKEPMSRLIYRSIHPEDVDEFKKAELLILNNQNHEDVRFRVISRSGLRQMKISFRRIDYENNTGVLGIISDITAVEANEQQLSEALRFSQQISSVFKDLIFISNRDNTILKWDENAVKKTGIQIEDALNHNLFDLFPALNEEVYLSNLQLVFEGRTIQKTGAKVGYFNKPYNYHLYPVKNALGQVEKVLHVVEDVSKEMDLQQQLNDRLNFIESLVEASVDRIVVLDSQMNYIYWNHKAEEYYAISKQKVLGKNVMEVFPAFRNDPGYLEFRIVLKGETVHIPAVMAGDDASSYFETFLTPVKNERGDVTAVLWVVHDLSREWQLQQEQKKAAELLMREHNRMKEAQTIGHVGSFEWDRATNTEYWSDELFRIYGMEPQSRVITIEDWFELIASENQPWVKNQMLQLYKEPHKTEFTNTKLVTNGVVRQLLYKAESFADKEGKVSHVTGTVQDITDLVNSEEQVKKLNLSLQNQNRELAYKNEELSSFALIATHDLREPLRKVQIFSDWLLQEENDQLSQKGKSLLQKTVDNTRRMDQLIDDMLVLSRLHQEDGKTEMVDLNNVLGKAKNKLKDQIELKHVVIENEELPVLKGSSDQLFYLFFHLLGNAIKFQNNDIIPKISIHAEKLDTVAIGQLTSADRSYWRIAFIDNGIGFEQQNATRIFQIFQRLHGNHEFPGTGIGLSICRKVMENHGGVIEAVSREGEGATFYCYFPVEKNIEQGTRNNE